MAAVTISTKGDHYACARSLNKDGGYVVFGLLCSLVARELNERVEGYYPQFQKGSRATTRSLPLQSLKGTD